MDALWSSTTPQDWVALGLIAMVPTLMVLAIYLIRREVRQAAQRRRDELPRSTTSPLHLKTTSAQREQWRMGKQRHPRAIADLADDIETLLMRERAGG